jgi:Fe-S oxidoreductase
MKTFEQFIKEQNAECIEAMNEDYCLDMPIYSPRQVIQLVDMWQKLQQTHVVGSGDGFPDEDDEDYDEPEQQCSACCMVGRHMPGCPEDYSAFAELRRNGYD